MHVSTRWMIAMAAAALLARAAASQPSGGTALPPVNGTEVVVTDTAGHRLVGYGVVQNDLLMLKMGHASESFLVILVAPDGNVESLTGVLGAAGALLVDLPDGSRERLSSYLGKNHVALRVIPQSDGPSRAKGGRASSDHGAPAAGSHDGSSSDGSSSDGSSSGGSSSDGSSTSGDVNLSVGLQGLPRVAPPLGGRGDGG